MNGNDKDMRSHIIETAIDIIRETQDVGKITVRQIAQRAGIGVGLINYYYDSKDQLLSVAIGEIMSRLASDIAFDNGANETDSVAKLKNMIKRLYTFSAEYESLIRFSLLQCIQNGDMGAELSIVPVLREIFKDTDEMQLRIIALQIILPIQAVSLSPAAFRMYSGIDLYNEIERNKFVDSLVDNLI